MTVELTFELKLASDYHIGAGYGLESGADAALKRDEDGWPAIDGTTLAGLLAEGMYRLLRSRALGEQHRACRRSARANSRDGYCGQHSPTAQPCPVCYMLGSPAQPKRWAISKARPADLPELRGTRHQQQLAAQTVARVRIDPRTRRAEEGKLFAREEGDGRLAFRFTATFVAPGTPPACEAAMLVAAARMVRAVGAGRRRGRGRCVLNLVACRGIAEWQPAAQEAALEQFKEAWLDGGTPAEWQRAPALAAARERPLGSGKGQHDWHMVVALRTEEPLLIARRAVAGNEFQTLRVIPGSVLRGALAQRLAARYDLTDTTGAAYRSFVELFLRDAVRFPTLMPALDLKGAVCPAIVAPRDLVCCSAYPAFTAEGGQAHPHAFRSGGAAVPEQCEVCGRNGSHAKMTAVRGLVPLSGELLGLEPTRASEAHQRIDPATGRVGKGDLFDYEVLAAGQYFVGEISCSGEEAWQALVELCALPEPDGEPLELRLGKAQRRGHGRVRLQFSRRADPEVHPWVGQAIAGRLSPGGEPAQRLVLTLLSDAILVDDWGRYLTGLEAGCPATALGLPDLLVERAFCASRTVDTFNDHLGLPRTRDIALVAGSSISLRLPQRRDGLLERLKEIEREGIGLRRNEGFGVVAFNHPIYQDLGGLTHDRISLIDKLCWPSGAGEETFTPAAEFLQEWGRKLEQEASQECRGEHFLPVARLLHHLAGEPFAEIRRQLEEMGRPRGLVADPLPARTKPDHYHGEGKAGMALVLRLLRDCETGLRGRPGQQAPQGPHLQRQAVEMLAEWVAGQSGLPVPKGGQR